MKTAIVTGASSGIGLEIVKELVERGYFVYGLSRDFTKCEFSNESFLKRECDLSVKKEITLFWELMKKKRVDVLVNCAGVGYFKKHEGLSLEEIESMIDINLKAPLYLSKLFFSHLKSTKGYIININSISAIKPAVFGAVYGASKAGLKHFGSSLWAESRKDGVKVVNIEPDITKTAWFLDKDFTYYDDSEYFIDPKEISTLVGNILELNSVVTDIVIEPKMFRIEKS